MTMKDILEEDKILYNHRKNNRKWDFIKVPYSEIYIKRKNTF